MTTATSTTLPTPANAPDWRKDPALLAHRARYDELASQVGDLYAKRQHTEAAKDEAEAIIERLKLAVSAGRPGASEALAEAQAAYDEAHSQWAAATLDLEHVQSQIAELDASRKGVKEAAQLAAAETLAGDMRALLDNFAASLQDAQRAAEAARVYYEQSKMGDQFYHAYFTPDYLADGELYFQNGLGFRGLIDGFLSRNCPPSPIWTVASEGEMAAWLRAYAADKGDATPRRWHADTTRGIVERPDYSKAVSAYPGTPEPRETKRRLPEAL